MGTVSRGRRKSSTPKKCKKPTVDFETFPVQKHEVEEGEVFVKSYEEIPIGVVTEDSSNAKIKIRVTRKRKEPPTLDAQSPKHHLASHVDTFATLYGRKIAQQMEEAQSATQITIQELDQVILECGEGVRMAYFLPLLHWMRKTEVIIDSVAVLDKPKALIREALEFTEAALSASSQPADMNHVLRTRFAREWWKIPASDYENLREMTNSGAKVRAVLTRITVQSFPDRETNETVECLIPQFRYYPLVGNSFSVKKPAIKRARIVKKASPIISTSSSSSSDENEAASPSFVEASQASRHDEMGAEP